MLKISKLYIFIILFSLFMGAAFATSALFVSSELMAHKQQQQKALITQLLHTHLINDAKTLSRQLRASVDFEFLTISDDKNNVLYRYIKDDEQRQVLSYVLKHFDLYTKEQRVKSDRLGLIIQFQSSFSQILTPLSLITMVALLAPILMTIFIYRLSEFVQENRLKTLINRVSQSLDDQGVEQIDTNATKKASNIDRLEALTMALVRKLPKDSEPSSKKTTTEKGDTDS